MQTILNNFLQNSFNQNITYHPAWIGRVSGLKAEKLLRGRKTPYLYVIRAGELENELESDYYITFVKPDFTIMHQPFVITNAEEGWYYENGQGGGPFQYSTTIDDVVHLIMHCSKDCPMPFIS